MQHVTAGKLAASQDVPGNAHCSGRLSKTSRMQDSSGHTPRKDLVKSIYQPLDQAKRQIRILEIHPGSGDDIVNATLRTESLPRLPYSSNDNILFLELWKTGLTIVVEARQRSQMRLQRDLDHWSATYDALEWLCHFRMRNVVENRPSLNASARLKSRKASDVLDGTKLLLTRLQTTASAFLDDLELAQQHSPEKLTSSDLQAIRKKLNTSIGTSKTFIRHLANAASQCSDKLPNAGSRQAESNALPGGVQALEFLPETDWYIPYEAISYCWGDLNTTQSMYLNGFPFEAPFSASNALRHLRDSTLTRCIWIDAICINQSDVSERGHQVMLMSSIYMSAQKTLVWLGDADEDTAAATQTLRRMAQLGSSEADETFPWEDSALADRARVVSTVFERPWFRRLWVYQEVILSQECVCFIGEYALAWEQLEDAVANIPSSRLSLGEEARSGATLAIWTKHQRRVWYHLTLPFYHLLSATSSLKCRDPRDTIYALLGLTIWARCNRSIPELIRPNYDAPIQDVMRDATVASIEEGACLDPLRYRVSVGQKPSWAVAWHTLPSSVGNGLQHFPPFWSRFTSEGQDACNGKSVNLEILTKPTSPESIWLAGHPVDMVVYASPELSVSKRQCQGVLERIVMCYAVLECADDFLHSHDVQFTSRRILSVITGYSVTNRNWLPDAEAFEKFCSYLDWYEAQVQARRQGRDHEANMPPPIDGLSGAAICERIEELCTNGKICITANGKLCLTDSGTNEGDEILILFGSDMPIVVRPQPQESWKTWIGAAYVEEIMRDRSWLRMRPKVLSQQSTRSGSTDSYTDWEM